MESNQKNSMARHLMDWWLKFKNAKNNFKMLAFVAFCCVLGTYVALVTPSYLRGGRYGNWSDFETHIGGPLHYDVVSYCFTWFHVVGTGNWLKFES